MIMRLGALIEDRLSNPQVKLSNKISVFLPMIVRVGGTYVIWIDYCIFTNNIVDKVS